MRSVWWVAQHLGLPSQLCIYGEICGQGVAVENDGSVYACDHCVYPEYRLGHIQDRPFGELAFTHALPEVERIAASLRQQPPH